MENKTETHSKVEYILKFDENAVAIATAAAECNKIIDINSEHEMKSAITTAKAANKAIKAIDTRRKEIVKPFNDKVKEINNYAKNLPDPLVKALDTLKKKISNFQDKLEKEKAEELARIEAERKELEVNDVGIANEERSIVDRLLEFDDKFQQMITMASNSDQCRKVWNKINDFYIDFGTNNDNYLQIKLYALQRATLKGKYHVDIEGMSDNHQKEIRKGRFQMEQEENALLKKEFIDKLKLQLQSNEILENAIQSSNINELAKRETEAKSSVGNQRMVWTFEVEDIGKVPVEYLEVKKSSINAAIKSGIREIPGVRIFQEKILVLI